MKKYSTYSVTAVAMACIMGMPSYAGDKPIDTNEWAMQAGTAISSMMRYPKLASRSGLDGSASFVVTIDREGDVLDYYRTHSKGPIFYKTAAVKAFKKADLPQLPDSYKGEYLSFTLNMNYIIQSAPESLRPEQSHLPKGEVAGTRIALLPTVSWSSAR